LNDYSIGNAEIYAAISHSHGSIPRSNEVLHKSKLAVLVRLERVASN